MLFSPRIRLRELAQLCRRLATGLEAGVDVRRVVAREVDSRAMAGGRRPFREISEAVDRGATLGDAMAETGDYFPRLFHELVNVGEQTGKLAEVFRRLAEHYEHQLVLRRMFLTAITWPMLQLAAAIGVIGLLIYVMGFLPRMEDGKPFDLLGFGLYGGDGFIKYCLVILAISAVVALVVRAIQRGMAWTRPVQYALVKIPGLGGALQTLSLAQLTWTMHITFEAGLDLLRALPLCLRSTRNAYYSDHIDDVLRAVRAGQEIHEAFADTKAFPRDFLENLEVGERAGRLPETMAIVSDQYQDQARRALATLTVLMGAAVWLMVAALIIFFIFRLAMVYLGQLNAALNMK